MNLVADESVDFRIVAHLRDAGLEVFAIAEQEPSIADEDVLKIAVNFGLPLLTEDKDFGELVFRLRLPHRGVILLRMAAISYEKRPIKAASIIMEHFSELVDSFSVFDGFHLRIRPGKEF
jgi:predicted nuclease of predicted toxin-antitoxin system